MSPRPDVSGERKAEILQAALSVFSRKGFDAARMEEIAAAAGLSVGGVYWYFDSKVEISLALMDTIYTPDVESFRELLAAPGTCRERLRRYFLDSLREEAEMLPLTFDLYRLASCEPRIKAALATYVAHYRRLLAELMQQGADRGEIGRVDPGAAAVTLMALYDGLLQTALAATDELDLEGMLAQVFDVVFEGLHR